MRSPQSHQSNLVVSARARIMYDELENYTFKISATSSKCQGVISSLSPEVDIEMASISLSFFIWLGIILGPFLLTWNNYDPSMDM